MRRIQHYFHAKKTNAGWHGFVNLPELVRGVVLASRGAQRSRMQKKLVNKPNNEILDRLNRPSNKVTVFEGHLSRL